VVPEDEVGPTCEGGDCDPGDPAAHVPWSCIFDAGTPRASMTVMLHRAAGTALLQTGLLLGACKTSSSHKRDDAPPIQTKVVEPLPDPSGAPAGQPEQHGDKWADP